MPLSLNTKDKLGRLLRWGLRPGSPGAIAFALGCVMVALGVRLAFWLFRPDLIGFATYYPAVLLATLIGGWSAGIVAQIAGGIAAWLFFDPSFAPHTQAVSDQIADFALYGLSSGLIIWACEHYRRVIRRLDEEEHYRRLLVDELHHRLKNKLAVVQAMLGYELQIEESVRAKILDRLRALAAADELLARPDSDVVDIHELLATELSYFAAARISTKGDRVLFPARYAATLTLIFHELATNAAKHGALKLPNGQVSICWRLEGSTLRIEWSAVSALGSSGARLIRSTERSRRNSNRRAFGARFASLSRVANRPKVACPAPSRSRPCRKSRCNRRGQGDSSHPRRRTSPRALDTRSPGMQCAVFRPAPTTTLVFRSAAKQHGRNRLHGSEL
jgi:two-component sensor histidine kinase